MTGLPPLRIDDRQPIMPITVTSGTGEEDEDDFPLGLVLAMICAVGILTAIWTGKKMRLL